MSTYSHSQITTLRSRLPYNSQRELADYLGFKSRTTIQNLFANPPRFTIELYNKIDEFIVNYESVSYKKLGKIIDKEAEYCHESAIKYLNGINWIMRTCEFAKLNQAQKAKLLNEQKAIHNRVDLENKMYKQINN